MKTVNAMITGITPLLMNRFSDAAALDATNGQRLSTSRERPAPEDDARSRLYIDEAGNIIMPQPNILMSMTAAGIYFKSGRSKISTQKSSLVPAAVMFNDIHFPFISEGGWHVDTRPVRIPATGGRILRYRPIFYDWSIKMSFDVDTDLIPLSTARELLDCAGSRVGLCDFRPACRGPFGRFRCDAWSID